VVVCLQLQVAALDNRIDLPGASLRPIRNGVFYFLSRGGDLDDVLCQAPEN